jgi:response regulator RpfG family c-di-GMP phosphodiesterase
MGSEENSFPAIHDRSLRNHIALRILQVAAGTQFDPFVVDILAGLFSETAAIPI